MLTVDRVDALADDLGVGLADPVGHGGVAPHLGARLLGRAHRPVGPGLAPGRQGGGRAPARSR